MLEAPAPTGRRPEGSKLSQTKIQHLGLAALRDENIGGLNVPMHDALGVRGVERVGDLNRQVEQGIDLNGLGLNAMLEGLPLQKLHHDKGLAFVFADFENGADVRVVERRSRARLALEALERLGVPGQIFGQKFERHKAAERGVFGFVHHSHSAAAQLFQNSIVRYGLPDHSFLSMLRSPRGPVKQRHSDHPNQKWNR